MAKLIVKSPYIKCTGNSGAAGAGGYLHYIGTREHVELIPDDRPPTRKQEQLIAKLVKDFPSMKGLFEYEDYYKHPTKANASALITLAFETNWDAVSQMGTYMQYIATRPRAERISSHGLFGDGDHVDLDTAMAELNSYAGNVWTHIISLHREDAARLGYDNAAAWRNLLRTHRNDIATAMKIPPKDFRWYAAFHDEGDHPHIHMMAWSTKPGQAYLSREGIRQIKSQLTNDIFKQELLHVYEQKSESRDELVREARDALLELTRRMQNGICNHPEVEGLMQQLSQALDSVTGKKSYGYLPKPIKKIADEIVDQMERLPVVSDCYDRWLELQGQVGSYYGGDERKRLKLSQQKEFRAIKNAVIQEAEHIRLGEITFEDAGMEQRDEPEDDLQADRTLWQIMDDVYDDTQPLAERDAAVADLKSWAEDGDATAQYFLGKLYRDGGLLIPNSELARDWFYKAARQDVVIAQYALGKLFLSDDLLVRDTTLGMEWLEYAASNGSHYAAYRVGKEYLKGEIVKKDMGRALRYLTDAANAENQYAQYLLGKLCLMGREVKYGKELALCWLTRAADQGNEYAQFFLDRADSLHPPSFMLAATRLLHYMSRIFQDNSLPKTGPVGMRIDRKRLQKLREKKIAMGHKPDDHEEYTGPTLSM
ncbi:MobP3 family relaxase [Oscillibacter sp.]|uniref:MobP3 family relaxase n=1 Tax=Oscillibacter sp. TaxID=1945593 RepID=UPI0033978F04